MNNKGFTIVEVLVAFVLISIVLVFLTKEIGSTLSITKKESYELMKENILKSASIYIKECTSKQLDCNIQWENNQTTFEANILKENGYYKNLKSPIDNKELGKCLIIKVTKTNETTKEIIIDNCY